MCLMGRGGSVGGRCFNLSLLVSRQVGKEEERPVPWVEWRWESGEGRFETHRSLQRQESAITLSH